MATVTSNFGGSDTESIHDYFPEAEPHGGTPHRTKVVNRLLFEDDDIASAVDIDLKRKAVREGRVEIAPQDKIGDHRQQVDRILRDIGFPEAIVTDESLFLDFPLDGADYDQLNRQYGFAVGRRDRIAAVAERLAGL